MTGKKNSGRTKSYSSESVVHLQRLWHIMGRICSKKMVAALPIWLRFYTPSKGISNYVKDELLSMSSSTIDRYLKSYKARFSRSKRSGTRRSKKFKNVIPIKSFDQIANRPGYLQADTVTDEFSGWTANRALNGKNASNTLEAVVGCLYNLPFDIISFNTDNGTEFLNSQIHSYISIDKNIQFTRSRTYRKNDNAHVEQKNFTHVRELFGYDRLEGEGLVESMNYIYKNYFNLLHNFFILQLKSIEVTRVGSKYKRKYDDTPKTPYQRPLNSDKLSKYQKENLRKTYLKLENK